MTKKELIELLNGVSDNANIFINKSDNERNDYLRVSSLDIEIVTKRNSRDDYKLGDIILS